MTHPDLTRLLSDAPAVRTRYGTARLECRTIGDLHLPSGRVVACDALVEPALPPFARAVAPGSYPVWLSIAHLPGDDQRIAAAWLRLAEGLAEQWEPALLEGLPDQRDPAYGVDSGTGAFLSAEAAPLLASRLDDDFAEEAAAAMQAQYADTREWAILPAPGAAGLHVALFSSGMGDGAYSSYWGFDAGGQAVCLLTDFDMVGRQGEGAATKPWWKFW